VWNLACNIKYYVLEVPRTFNNDINKPKTLLFWTVMACFEIYGLLLIVGLEKWTDKLATGVSRCGEVQENTVWAKKIRDFCHLWKIFVLLLLPILRSCFVLGHHITRTCTGLQTVLSSSLIFHQKLRNFIAVFWNYDIECCLCTQPAPLWTPYLLH
jgi:hypothetical protein